MKDNFSNNAGGYAKFRPTYTNEVYDFIIPLVANKHNAWDCATGNGQVAIELSKYFEKVYATDISEKQIEHALQGPNIFYKVEPAEKTSFTDHFFDLITVGQAIHWFDFDTFYKEVRRVMKPNGIMAVIGYGLFAMGDETDEIILNFYNNIIGPYWDAERKYIDENYQTIPFPFHEIESPVLFNTFEWNFEQLLGFLETWSAVQHYIKTNKNNPVELILKDLKRTWGHGIVKTIKFPVLLKIGKVEK